MADRLDSFKDALGGDVIRPGIERARGLSAVEVLATRSWFDRHRSEISSSGGRPTNPKWTIKRQVPLAPETWNELKALALLWGTNGRKLGPGHVAAFLLEDALLVLRGTSESARRDRLRPMGPSSDDDLDAGFANWVTPVPFFGRAA
jgi:hypothetical protein